MARLQALRQQHFLESSSEPLNTRGVEGQSGVPKMHPLNSSHPILKMTNLLHGMKIRSMGVKMPRLGGGTRLGGGRF